MPAIRRLFCLPRLGGRTIGSTSDSESDYPGSSPGLPAKFFLLFVRNIHTYEHSSMGRILQIHQFKGLRFLTFLNNDCSTSVSPLLATLTHPPRLRPLFATLTKTGWGGPRPIILRGFFVRGVGSPLIYRKPLILLMIHPSFRLHSEPEIASY